jgi:hypothetical protein
VETVDGADITTLEGLGTARSVARRSEEPPGETIRFLPRGRPRKPPSRDQVDSMNVDRFRQRSAASLRKEREESFARVTLLPVQGR